MFLRPDQISLPCGVVVVVCVSVLVVVVVMIVVLINNGQVTHSL